MASVCRLNCGPLPTATGQPVGDALSFLIRPKTDSASADSAPSAQGSS